MKKNTRNISLEARICRFERNNFLDNKWCELLLERGVLAGNGLRAEVFKPSFPPCLSPFLFLKESINRVFGILNGAQRS